MRFTFYVATLLFAFLGSSLLLDSATTETNRNDVLTAAIPSCGALDELDQVCGVYGGFGWYCSAGEVCGVSLGPEGTCEIVEYDADADVEILIEAAQSPCLDDGQ